MHTKPAHCRCLTPEQKNQRAIDMLLLAADGHSLRDIAKKHKTSEQTIKNRMREYRETIGAKSVTHALGIAIRQGFIQLTPVSL